MKRFRVSVAGLMGIVLLAGVAFAALRNPTLLWANAFFSLYLALLTLAILGAWYRRAFWKGFLVFGGTYFLLNFAPWFNVHFSPHLLTTSLFDMAYADKHIASPDSDYFPVNGGSRSWGSLDLGAREPVPWPMIPGHGPTYWSQATRFASMTGAVKSDYFTASNDRFQRIGHSLFGMIAALIGGFAAWCFVTPNLEPDRPHPTSE